MDKRVDNTDIPFENDESILGEWEYIDFIEKIDYFTSNQITWIGEDGIKRLKFLSEGVMLVDVGDGELRPTTFTWTKDFIINKTDETCSSYTIKTIDDSTYLFFEWKSGDYSYRMMNPYFYVLRKV